MHRFGIHARYDGPFDDAVANVTDALETEGFGEPTLQGIAREVHDKLARAVARVDTRR